MDKTKIQAIRIQSTGILPPEYNSVFSGAAVQLDGSLKLKNVAYGLYVSIGQDGLNGTMGLDGGFPDPVVAKYGFTLTEPFNMLSMSVLRDLTTEETIQTVDCLVLLKNSEYVNNIIVKVNENFPTQNGIENFFHDKTFALTAQSDNLIYFCPSTNAYLKFDVAVNKIMCLYSGSNYSDVTFEDNYVISTDLTKLNQLGSGMTSKLIFEEVPIPKKMKRTGSVATVIRRK
ncbi:hypothetical protein KA977_15080 [Candidatus Dependentiae bacterium]|nr:hypothetical protein [Candidatus Dependentiae bacterium]